MSGPGPALEQGQRCPVPRSPPRVSWGGGGPQCDDLFQGEGKNRKDSLLVKKKKIRILNETVVSSNDSSTEQPANVILPTSSFRNTWSRPTQTGPGEPREDWPVCLCISERGSQPAVFVLRLCAAPGQAPASVRDRPCWQRLATGTPLLSQPLGAFCPKETPLPLPAELQQDSQNPVSSA